MRLMNVNILKSIDTWKSSLPAYLEQSDLLSAESLWELCRHQSLQTPNNLFSVRKNPIHLRCIGHQTGGVMQELVDPMVVDKEGIASLQLAL
jgi:hypothetical protein